jgi:phosphoribosylanthranilate isomerase
MMRTRVKICGFTRVEDAVYAAQSGVDAIGLVFYPPSPRSIDINQAVKIVNALPAFVSVVALFVDEQESRIRDVLKNVAIDCLQFHGDETPEACRQYGKRYLKAIRMRPEINVSRSAENYHDAAGLLLDAYDSGTKGGTGSPFNWDLVPKTCRLPIVLAGGLDISNVRQAIQLVRPYAVDVSSGVEADKGIKDNVKMATFVKEVNETDKIL